MTLGLLVEDDTLRLVLLEHLPEGFLLDGYPRTAAEAEALDELLGPRELEHVLELTVPETVLTPRLLERAAAHGRVDDTPETIAARFEVYRAEIEGLRAYYGARIVTVDGVGGSTPSSGDWRGPWACRRLRQRSARSRVRTASTVGTVGA